MGDRGEGDTCLVLCLPIPATSLGVFWAGAMAGSEQGSAAFWSLWADRLSGFGSMRPLGHS